MAGVSDGYGHGYGSGHGYGCTCLHARVGTFTGDSRTYLE